MSDEQKTSGEEHIAALLKMAGPRPRIAEETRARVRGAVHEEWQRNVRRTRTRVVGWSAAAIAATAAIVFVVQRSAVEQPTPVAESSLVAVARKVQGAVIAREKAPAEAGAPFLLAEGTVLRAGQSIETSAGATVAFDWSGGSLRVAENSQLRIDTPGALTLARGAIYFASAPGSRSVEVRTRFGVVRDIGTQFEVRVAEEIVRVRVREGRVDLRSQSGSHTADAGTELAARLSGDITRKPIPTSGAEWDWVIRAAPPMTLDGNVQEILTRIAREKGLALRLADPSIASMTVHGNVPLGPDEALDAAVAATGLRYRVTGETLLVERIK